MILENTKSPLISPANTAMLPVYCATHQLSTAKNAETSQASLTFTTTTNVLSNVQTVSGATLQSMNASPATLLVPPVMDQPLSNATTAEKSDQLFTTWLWAPITATSNVLTASIKSTPHSVVLPVMKTAPPAI